MKKRKTDDRLIQIEQKLDRLEDLLQGFMLSQNSGRIDTCDDVMQVINGEECLYDTKDLIAHMREARDLDDQIPGISRPFYYNIYSMSELMAEYGIILNYGTYHARKEMGSLHDYWLSCRMPDKSR